MVLLMQVGDTVYFLYNIQICTHVKLCRIHPQIMICANLTIHHEIDGLHISGANIKTAASTQDVLAYESVKFRGDFIKKRANCIKRDE